MEKDFTNSLRKKRLERTGISMKKLWLVTKICVKAIGDLFDFLEPFAIALDEPIAWVLTVASVAMGVISLLTMGGWRALCRELPGSSSAMPCVRLLV